MPIAFKDVDVARLEWTTQLENTNGQTSETFQLDRFQHTCNPYFKVSCTYSFIGDAVKDLAELHFTLVEQPLANGQLHSGGCNGSTISNYRPRPRSIWVGFNDKSFPLIESADRSGEWNNSEKFIVDLNHSGPGLNRSLQLTCLFYIEFRTFGLREANAVKHLAELFAKQTDCDVRFCFRESQLEIGAHVYVLASRSHVFAAAFRNNETPAEMMAGGQVLVEDNIQPNVFKEMLHYIYSGKTSTPLTEDMAKSLFLAAATYVISDLVKECTDFLLRSINLKNAINLMIWSHLNAVEDVEEAALSYAARHGRKIVFQEDFEKLIRNYPELCLVTTRRMIDIISPRK